LALENPNNNVIEVLLKAKADPTMPGTHNGKHLHAPLFAAVMCNNTAFFGLVARICGDSALQTTDPEHGGLLHAATCHGHVGVVEVLLASKCDANHRTRFELPSIQSWRTYHIETPLWMACFYGEHAIVKPLLNAKANATMEHLELAIEQGELQVLKSLLDAKTDPTTTDESTGFTLQTALAAAVTSSAWDHEDKTFDPAALELMMTHIMKTETKKQADPLKTCTLRLSVSEY
jgi:ankyrin repeat protein